MRLVSLSLKLEVPLWLFALVNLPADIGMLEPRVVSIGLRVWLDWLLAKS